MKKFFTTLLIVLFAASFSLAATGITAKGFKAGLNLATITGADVPSDVKSKMGFIVGGFLTFSLSDMIAIQPEIYFSQKGDKSEGSISGYTYKYWDNLTYLEIPILIKVTIPVQANASIQPNIFVGPSLGLKLSGKYKTEWSDNTSDEGDIDGLKSTDFGLVFGGGLDFALGAAKALIDVRYTMGLTNIIEATGGGEESRLKNSVFSILFGIGF